MPRIESEDGQKRIPLELGAGFVELGRKDLEGLKEPDPRKVSEKQCEIRLDSSANTATLTTVGKNPTSVVRRKVKEGGQSLIEIVCKDKDGRETFVTDTQTVRIGGTVYQVEVCDSNEVTLYDGDRFGLRGTGSKDWFYFFTSPVQTHEEPAAERKEQKRAQLPEALPSPKRICVDTETLATTADWESAKDNGTWSKGIKPGEAKQRDYSLFENPTGPSISPLVALQLNGDSYFFNTIHLRQPGDPDSQAGGEEMAPCGGRAVRCVQPNSEILPMHLPGGFKLRRVFVSSFAGCRSAEWVRETIMPPGSEDVHLTLLCKDGCEPFQDKDGKYHYYGAIGLQERRSVEDCALMIPPCYNNGDGVREGRPLPNTTIVFPWRGMPSGKTREDLNKVWEDSIEWHEKKRAREKGGVAAGEGWIEVLDDNGGPRYFWHKMRDIVTYEEPDSFTPYAQALEERSQRMPSTPAKTQVERHQWDIQKEYEDCPETSIHGCMHAKMIIAEYDNYLRVFITSGNFECGSFTETLDVVWIQDFPRRGVRRTVQELWEDPFATQMTALLVEMTSATFASSETLTRWGYVLRDYDTSKAGAYPVPSRPGYADDGAASEDECGEDGGEEMEMEEEEIEEEGENGMSGTFELVVAMTKDDAAVYDRKDEVNVKMKAATEAMEKLDKKLKKEKNLKRPRKTETTQEHDVEVQNLTDDLKRETAIVESCESSQVELAEKIKQIENHTQTRCELHREHTLFVTDIPRVDELDADSIRPVFEKYGTILRLHVAAGDLTKYPEHKCAFIEYESPHEAENARKALHDRFRFNRTDSSTIKVAKDKDGNTLTIKGYEGAAATRILGWVWPDQCALLAPLIDSGELKIFSKSSLKKKPPGKKKKRQWICKFRFVLNAQQPLRSDAHYKFGSLVQKWVSPNPPKWGLHALAHAAKEISGMADHPEEEVCFAGYSPCVSYAYTKKKSKLRLNAPDQSDFLDGFSAAFGKMSAMEGIDLDKNSSQSSQAEENRTGAARAWNGNEWPVFLQGTPDVDIKFRGFNTPLSMHPLTVDPAKILKEQKASGDYKNSDRIHTGMEEGRQELQRLGLLRVCEPLEGDRRWNGPKHLNGLAGPGGGQITHAKTCARLLRKRGRTPETDHYYGMLYIGSHNYSASAFGRPMTTDDGKNLIQMNNYELGLLFKQDRDAPNHENGPFNARFPMLWRFPGRPQDAPVSDVHQRQATRDHATRQAQEHLKKNPAWDPPQGRPSGDRIGPGKFDELLTQQAIELSMQQYEHEQNPQEDPELQSALQMSRIEGSGQEGQAVPHQDEDDELERAIRASLAEANAKAVPVDAVQSARQEVRREEEASESPRKAGTIWGGLNKQAHRAAGATQQNTIATQQQEPAGSSVNRDAVKAFLRKSCAGVHHVSIDTLHAVLQCVLSVPATSSCAVVMLPGSFNPVHREHLHSLDIAVGNVTNRGTHVVGAFLQPSSDAYLSKKLGLAQTIGLKDRCECCDTMLAEAATRHSCPYGVYSSGETNGMAALRGLVDLLNAALCEMGGSEDHPVLRGVYVIGADSLLRSRRFANGSSNPLASATFMGSENERVVIGREGSKVPLPLEGIAPGWQLELGTQQNGDKTGTSDVSSTKIREILLGVPSKMSEGAALEKKRLLVEAGCGPLVAAELLARRIGAGLFQN